jgi:hypothetical protein
MTYFGIDLSADIKSQLSNSQGGIDPAPKIGPKLPGRAESQPQLNTVDQWIYEVTLDSLYGVYCTLYETYASTGRPALIAFRL